MNVITVFANARMQGDGPPHIQISPRSIRYALPALLQWMKSKQQMFTSGDPRGAGNISGRAHPLPKLFSVNLE
jgi:hypothetical protein